MTDELDIEIIKTPVEAKSRKLKWPAAPEGGWKYYSHDEFYSHHGEIYERNRVPRRGYSTIEVLEFLKGRQWDDIALAYVHSLRPSSIRVTKGECTCDHSLWRVTVFIDNDNVIESIEQSVEVALPDGIEDAYNLRIATQQDE